VIDIKLATLSFLVHVKFADRMVSYAYWVFLSVFKKRSLWLLWFRLSVFFAHRSEMEIL